MGEKDLYTGGPHGLLSCFITNEIPGILQFFQLHAGPSVTPLNERTVLMFLFGVPSNVSYILKNIKICGYQIMSQLFQTLCFFNFFYKNGRTLASFSFILSIFTESIQFLQQINVKKCRPSSIRHRDLNPGFLKHESSPIITRPRLFL